MGRALIIPLCFLLSTFSVMACNLNSPLPLSAKLTAGYNTDQPRTVLISTNTHLLVPATQGTLQLHDAQSVTLLSQLTQWPIADAAIAPFIADPHIMDTNYDGIADVLYAITSDGMLWLIPLHSRGFGTPSLLADLRDSGLLFNQPLHVVQTLAADQLGLVRSLAMVLVTGSDATGDTLIAVKHRAQNTPPVVFSQLVNRSSISDDEIRFGVAEQLWNQLQDSAGWQIALQQQLTLVPQVYGGVVYFTTAAASDIAADCEVADDAPVALHALHLHHAGLVYAQRKWRVPLVSSGQLSVQTGANGELMLAVDTDEQPIPLLTDLLSISEECADCIAPLRAAQYPQRVRLATFQTELGAH